MPNLATIARWEARVIVVGFCLVIAWNVVSGRVRLSDLLSGDRANGETYFSWGRAQLLAVLLWIVGQYIFRFYLNPSKFPNVPNASVTLFASSAVLYTGEKVWASLFDQSGSTTRRLP
jgi:hypothetical protein